MKLIIHTANLPENKLNVEHLAILNKALAVMPAYSRYTSRLFETENYLGIAYKNKTSTTIELQTKRPCSNK